MREALLAFFDHHIVRHYVAAHLIDQALVDGLSIAAHTTEEFLDGVKSPCHALDRHLEHHSRLDRLFHRLRSL